MMNRVVLLALLSLASCGIVFAPGDYEASPPAAPISGDGQAPNNSSEAGTDAASDGASAPAVGTRIVLFGGRRDVVPGEPTSNVAETLLTSFLPDGTLSPFRFGASPPSGASWARVLYTGSDILIQQGTNVSRGPFDGGASSAWTNIPQRGSPESGGRPWLFDGGLIAAGSSSSANNSANVYVAPFVDGGLGSYVELQTKLVTARGEVTLYRHDNFAYAIGGTNKATATTVVANVEVGKIAGGELLEGFVDTKPLPTPLILPLVTSGAGYLVVIGGQTSTNAAAITDLVYAAKIDPATGALADWQTLPRLPTQVANAGVVVVNDKLLVFGGNSVTTLSDSVMMLPLNPIGTEWKRIGTLPAPRTGLVATVY